MAANVPPVPGSAGVPPRKKTSPIVWILLTLAGLFVFAIIGTAVAGYFVYHKVKQAGFDVALLEKKPELAFLKMAVAGNPDAEIVSIDEDRGIATIKDKKTGKVITMNFEDIKKGRFTLEENGQKATFQTTGEGGNASIDVTGPEGSAHIGAGAVKLPSWLPAYAGTKVEGFATESAEGSAGGFGFKSSDSAEKVAAFYNTALKGAGFTVELNERAGGAILQAESGSRKAMLNIAAEGSGSAVNGTFEDK